MAADTPDPPELDYEEAKAILERLAAPYVEEPSPAPTGQESPSKVSSLPPKEASRPSGPGCDWSKTTLQALLESLPDALVAVNREGMIVFCTSQTESLFGYTKEELLGQAVEILVPEHVIHRHVDYRNEYLKKPRARPIGVGLELRGRRKDGSEVPVEISLSPLNAEEGLIVLAAIRDMRQRKREEAKYHTLVESIPAVTFVAPLDVATSELEVSSELYVSPQIEQMLGFTQKEWLEDPILWYRQLHPDDQKRWNEQFAPTCSTGGPFRDIYRFIAKDGRVVWVQGAANMVRDETGHPLFLQGLAFDVTSIKEAELASRRLAAIVESSDDAIIGKTLDGIITSWNRGAQNIYGYRPNEMIGQSIRRLIPPEREDELAEILARLRRGEHVQHYETVRVRQDGQRIYVSLTISPIKDAEGKTTGASTVARDITRRKRAEQQLREQAALHALEASISTSMTRINSLSTMLQECTEALVEHLDVAFARIWRFDPDDNILQLCASAGLYTHLDGGHSRVPVGQYKIGLIAQEKRPYFTNDVLNDPRISDRQWAAREGMVAFAGYPLIVDDELVGVMATFARSPFTDTVRQALELTALQVSLGIKRKQGEEELEQRVNQRTRELTRLLHELDEKSAELEKFAAIASHDFSKPLRSLLNWPHKLAQEYGHQLDERANDWLRRTLAGGERLRQLIQDVSTYRKVLPRNRPFEPVDCNLALENALENLEADLRETEARVTIDSLPTVLAHPTDIVLLFQNLIGNALKYRRKDVIPEISVASNREEADWLICIRDNGIGMEEKYLKRIFVLGERLHPESKYPGSGFGLSICEKIVQAHGGRIWVESTLDEGSSFYFTLPDNAVSKNGQMG